MTNNYVPNSDLAFIIGDGGISRASPAPTKVGGEKINACLELQSTTRADLFLKPKTDVQIASIPNATIGMLAFSSDTGQLMANGYSGWAPVGGTPVAPVMLYANIELTTLDLQFMVSGNPLVAPGLLEDPPGTELTYIIHGIRFNLTENGAVFTVALPAIRAMYDFITVDEFDDYASSPIPNSFFSTGTGDRSFYVTGNSTNRVRTASVKDTRIVLSAEDNPGFSFTGNPTATVDVWYSIV